MFFGKRTNELCRMNIRDEILRELIENYFQKSLSEILPTVLKESIKKSVMTQEFISLNILQRFRSKNELAV